jgi:photosynthetic reaction center H subunit
MEAAMGAGQITGYIDVAQVTLYVFWVFFALLIIYLRREDKREGYPLETDRPERLIVQGFPSMPSPKTFLLAHGGSVTVPRAPDSRPIAAAPVAPWPGAPLVPTGNPMLDGVGPASYAQRADVPDMTVDGLPAIVPMRVATEFSIDNEDPDPRGMAVIAADRVRAGTVVDVWIDRTEPQIRYLEVEVSADAAAKHVLVPVVMVDIDGRRRRVKVDAIFARQFADVPVLANPTQVTKLEEDRITGYFAGGTLYAAPDRAEPLL